MALNGTMRKHEKTVGYIVRWGNLAGTLCHGYENPNRHIILGSQPVTIFRTRRHAQRAIRDTIADGKDASGNQFQILRVAFPSVS